ncbi:MAG TPA: diacylglycerol kinase family lipid kinase [Bacteroidales bacterium]|nr:diacylglycerol kinase family lipid kinase [Bacteroidales bacterium]
MENSKRILFIINPVSGVGKKKVMERLIAGRFGNDPDVSVVFTGHPGHATEISRRAASDGVDIVVAVGGDGTVNEVASGLVGTQTAMAILPAGSGNGLARHLKIPMNPRRALELISERPVRTIDTAEIDGQLFVNVAGIGFDAAIAKKFAAAGKRGFSTYFRVTADTYKNYRSKKYILTIDGKIIRRRALMVSFANSSQFGNNASIDPAASVSDGFIDVCIVGKMPLHKVAFLAPLLFMGKFDKTRYVEIIRAREVLVKRKKGKTIHLDGDPKTIGREFTVKIHPLSLRVVAPPKTGTGGLADQPEKL